MSQRLRAWTARHETFLLILLLFVAFRLFAVWLMRPGGFIADASDYDFYAEWGSLTARGYRTFDNLWTAYPPLFPALMLPIYELSSRIPPWVEPRLAFHVLFGAFLLIFEAGNLALIYRLSGKLEQDGSYAPPVLSPVVFYALLFAPVHTLLGWFESMPLFFLLLGLDLLIGRGKVGWIASAIAVALGFLIKLTPIVLAPVAVRWLGARLSWQAARREWLNPSSPGNLLRPGLYVIICIGVILGLGFWLVGGKLDLAFSSFRINALRPPWQSIWALWDGFYGYGLVPLDMRNLDGLNRVLWESRVPWGWIGAIFALLYLWLYTRPYDWTQTRTPIAFTAVSVILLFLYSKGWSPQFVVWILVFVVLLLPSARGVFTALALTMLNFIESYIYLIILPDERWVIVGTALLRTLFLVLLMAEFLSQIWPGVSQRAARAIGRLTWVSLALLAIFIAVGSPIMANAYSERRFAEHPCRAAIDFLRAEAGGPNDILATTQPEVQRLFYPWLRSDYTIRVIDGYNPQDRPFAEVEAERLAAFVGEREFWWVQMNAQALAPTPYFERPAVHVLEEHVLGECRLARVLQIDTQTPLATFHVVGGPIRLIHAEMESAQMGALFDLVLYWQADDFVAESYTVFTQIVDSAGQIVAQQDNPPMRGAAPTDKWLPGVIIRDAYRLHLPDAASGDLKLLVGLYTNAGRVPATLPDGVGRDAFELRVVAGE